jgi:hypothetical protein
VLVCLCCIAVANRVGDATQVWPNEAQRVHAKCIDEVIEQTFSMAKVMQVERAMECAGPCAKMLFARCAQKTSAQSRSRWVLV